jgi:hypothetical protein
MEKSYDFLYHITKLCFLDNIITEGLLINSNKNGFVKKGYIKEYYKKYDLQPIFLTNNYNYIIETQLPPSFFKKCIVLKINSVGLDIEDEFEYLNQRWNLYFKTKKDFIKNISKNPNRSFICKEDIKPELIKIIKNGKEL